MSTIPAVAVPGRETGALPSLCASRGLRICLWALLLTGFATRLAPLVDLQGRLFWQWMTEDGYLMQTVARNMAIGLGMSTAAGTLPTNGVQPLAAFVFAALHLLAGGSKLAGIVWVTLLSAAVAAVAAWFVYRVGARVLAPLPQGREVAAVAALLWFAAPRNVAHTMNGLETGIYYMAIGGTLTYYLAATADASQPLGWKRRLTLGLLLGLTFLARNDAVFLIAGLLLSHMVVGGVRAGGGWRRRVADAVVAGLVSLLVATPWLVNNHLLFGSIVPISGTAQSHATALGINLLRLPAILFEAATLYVPIPQRFESQVAVALVAGVAVVAVLASFGWLACPGSLASQRVLITGVVFLAGVSLYYGVFFGAPHFLNRYTSPLSIFLWLATAASVLAALRWVIRSPRARAAAALGLVALLAVESLVAAGRSAASGRTHMHRQVVAWVQSNVPASTWVGAVQSGTLGYFHDRTINLDGKVNPAALRARIRDGHVQSYILDSKVDVIADWVGIASWMDLKDTPRFTREFELVVKDERLNLGVLRRIGPPERQPVAQ